MTYNGTSHRSKWHTILLVGRLRRFLDSIALRTTVMAFAAGEFPRWSILINLPKN
jgi:hypothetical protein